MIEPPLALLDHDPPGRAHAEEDPGLHDGDRREPLLVGDVLRVRADVADARVVDDDVEPAEVRERARERRVDLGALRDVRREGLRAHAERGELVRGGRRPPARGSPRRRCRRRRARAARRCHGRGPRRRPSRAPPSPRGSCPPKLHSTLQGRDRLSRLSSPRARPHAAAGSRSGCCTQADRVSTCPGLPRGSQAGGLVQLPPHPSGSRSVEWRRSRTRGRRAGRSSGPTARTRSRVSAATRPI